MMQLVFLRLTHKKEPILINAINIKDILPAKKGGGSVISYDGEEDFVAVEETIDQIENALAGVGLLRKPANL